MKKTLILIFGILLLSSCGSKQSMALHPERLSLGMTKSEVKIAMGEHIPMKIIGSKYYENGTIEVGQYYDKMLMYGRGLVEEIYYLYFFNDELIQWGRPQDWQKEADRIYEIRFR
jgi:PBP1b-binding outer membrane lipoprotein LpoB